MKKLAESKPRCGGKQSSSVFGTCAHCGRMNIRLIVSARLGAIYCKSCYNNTYNRARVASPSARRVKRDWTPAEDVLLTRIYGHGERIEILNAFPTRSWSVIIRFKDATFVPEKPISTAIASVAIVDNMR